MPTVSKMFTILCLFCLSILPHVGEWEIPYLDNFQNKSVSSSKGFLL